MKGSTWKCPKFNATRNELKENEIVSEPITKTIVLIWQQRLLPLLELSLLPCLACLSLPIDRRTYLYFSEMDCFYFPPVTRAELCSFFFLQFFLTWSAAFQVQLSFPLSWRTFQSRRGPNSP